MQWAIMLAGTTFVLMTTFMGAPALTISTLPFDVPDAQVSVFKKLGQHLSEEIGRPIRFLPGQSYSKVVKKLLKKKIDVAFMGAASYVRARKGKKVKAFLRTIRRRKSHYYGVIVVGRETGITTMEGLRGKRFGFVDPDSTAGYHFAKELLKRSGLRPGADLDTLFVGSHHQVVEMVAKNELDAGACYEGAQNMLANPDEIIPIARTDKIITDPVVARAGLPAALIEKLRSAFISLSTVEAAKQFLFYADIDGFLPAQDSDYDPIAKVLRQQNKAP